MREFKNATSDIQEEKESLLKNRTEHQSKPQAKK